MDNDLALNEEQEALLEAPEQRILGVAGPGTGKTTVFVRRTCKEIHKNANSNNAVCALTFTNGATEVIRKRLSDRGLSGGFPNFLGTIDTFLLQYLVQPFAAAAGWVPETGVRLLAGDQETHLHQPECRIDDHHNSTSVYKFSFCGGTLEKPTFDVQMKNGRSVKVDSGWQRDRVLETKIDEVWKKHGLMTHSDCAYVAAKLLANDKWQDRITAGFAARFNVLLIDEVQDIGVFRLRALLDLAEGADVDVFLVGDPDQAIYQFQGATPSRLNELDQRREFEVYNIPKTYRFGKSISEASEAFSTLERSLQPAAKSKEDKAELYFHKWRPREQRPFAELSEWLNEEMGRAESAAVLARKHATLDYIRYGGESGQSFSITPFNRRGINVFADAVRQLQGKQPSAGRAMLNSAASHYVFGEAQPPEAALNAEGFERNDWTERVWNIGLVLSEFDQNDTWDDWRLKLIEQLEQLKHKFPEEYRSEKKLGRQLGCYKKEGRSAEEPFEIEAPALEDELTWPTGTEFSTVHGAKGREFDVVAYVAPIGQHNRRKAPTAWSDESNTEGRCVAYVACSRAIRALGVFICEDYRDEMGEKCPEILSSFDAG